MKKSDHVIAKKILFGSLSATAWAFDLLVNMGMATIEVFLNPSLYADIPSFSTGDRRSEKIRRKKKFKENTIRQSIWRLQEGGFVVRKGKNYCLTARGKNLAAYIISRKKAIDKKWDGKYRVVIFDIPEKKNKLRDWLRYELILLNYKKLQESVFIGKWPLPVELIKDIKRNKIGDCVNYILADKIYKNVT
ncbi:MAG: hypothetical protein WC608_05170 [Parcubacteria group bacterium]